MWKLKGERKHGTLKQGTNFNVSRTWHSERECRVVKDGMGKCTEMAHESFNSYIIKCEFKLPILKLLMEDVVNWMCVWKITLVDNELIAKIVYEAGRWTNDSDDLGRDYLSLEAKDMRIKRIWFTKFPGSKLRRTWWLIGWDQREVREREKAEMMDSRFLAEAADTRTENITDKDWGSEIVKVIESIEFEMPEGCLNNVQAWPCLEFRVLVWTVWGWQEQFGISHGHYIEGQGQRVYLITALKNSTTNMRNKGLC